MIKVFKLDKKYERIILTIVNVYIKCKKAIVNVNIIQKNQVDPIIFTKVRDRTDKPKS